ncbi:synaptotagmin-5 [Nasonia vitripennis]|uniref:C2 domain-containing protein n=1 Tax=Nasonia vitripennis TaxID=7425 RepID=A0A7M7QQ59_NASVI|nr:synaptotagmin-5 [Nasonia vitripennis]XP_032452364.1 synaptotagmin-5 [Nasonia vitripennis]
MGIGSGGDAMDPHGPEIVAILGAIGATAGAVSAVVVYALCARRRRVPLNWFEKDLLDRAEEAEKSSREEHALASLHPTLGILGKQASSGAASIKTEDEWQQPREGIFNNRVKETRDVGRHLSECSCDEAAGTSMSPLAPPLPGGGALVASDERMVILRSLPLTSCTSNGSESSCSVSAHARLSSTDSDDISCPRSANETRGELQMSITYDAPDGILNVKLVEARDLRARDLSETADPYAKIRLLPDRSTVKQTRIHKKTLNPEFDEDFVFQVAPNCQLAERTLEVLLYDFDASSKHRGLGYVQIPLSTVTDLGLEPKTLTKSVMRYGAEGRFRAPPLGELMVSLSYQPTAERLTVIVIRARNLPINDETGTATFEPYVQVNIVREDKSLKKKKTSIRREGTSPVWSESLNFDLTPDVLAECILDFSIFRANGELLARCEVSELRQRELFHRVLAGAGASAQWLPLSEPEKLAHDGQPELQHQLSKSS